MEYLITLTLSLLQKLKVSIGDMFFCFFSADRSTSLWPYHVLRQTAETGLISGVPSSLSVLTAAICDCFQETSIEMEIYYHHLCQSKMNSMYVILVD